MSKPSLLDPSLQSPEVRELENALRHRVVGQDRAVQHLARVFQVYKSGLSAPGRPIVNLLLLGPTGSGKTRLVEAAAEVLFGDPRAVVNSTAPSSSTVMRLPSWSGRLPATWATAKRSP